MSQGPTDTAALDREQLLDRLQGLKETAIGVVMHEEIVRLLDDHGTVTRRLDQLYSQLLQLLLEAYARAPDAQAVTELHARLIQVREEPELDPSPLAKRATAPGAGPLWPRPPRDAATGASAPTAAAAPAPPAEPPARGVEAGEVAGSDQRANERRVASAYRLHLDRKRDEIEKLQETLSQSVTEAVSQSREFGALLEIELRALQQADSVQEVERLRSILIGALEELILGQKSLSTKLDKTSDYLDLVKHDSQKLRDELSKVRLLSLTDEFTGLPNRRAFMRRLQDEISRAQRYGAPLTVALIDLDEFKAINDHYGHAGGDEVLRAYATEVLSQLRHHDMVARYGGEEFAVVLPNTVIDGARAALAKARARAREIHCAFEGERLPMPTFSAGLTLYIPGESPSATIERADRALYRAKRSGRNRTEVELQEAPAAPAP